MAEKKSFTKEGLERFVAKNLGGRKVIHDAKQPSLIAELRPGGTLTFFLYKWWNGGPVKDSIGAFPECTIETARKAVQKKLAKMTDGIDPRTERRRRGAISTLSEAFKEYLENHAKPKKRTWQNDENQFDRYLGPWKGRKLDSITTANVMALHAQLGKDCGIYAANRLRSLLCAIFAYAIETGWEGSNPTKGVRKFKEQSRDRFLTAEELKRFFAAVEADPSRKVADFVMMLLWTGARKGNVMAMRWEEIDVATKEWRIPLTKAGESQRVHLPDAAIEIIERRRTEAEKESPWVFPGVGANGHLTDPNIAWQRILEAANLKGLRMHDLRRTFGSWQAATGASLPTIGKSLGHKNQSTTAIYARLNLDPVRIAADAAVSAMIAAGKEEKKGGEA